MPFALLSRFRDPLMGFSILWILFFHSRIEIPDTTAWAGVDFVKSAGYGGVEIFFLLSGLGLAFGWAKRPLGYLDFLKRRVLRILPAFWVGIALFHGFFALRLEKAPTLLQLAEGFTGLDFWLTGNCGYWFVPAILAFYAVFPPLARLLWKESRLQSQPFFHLMATSLLLALGASLASRQDLVGHAYLLLVWIRIPLFLAGTGIGFALSQGTKINLPWWAGLTYLGAGGAWLWWIFEHVDFDVRWKTGLWWIPFWPMVIPLSLLVAKGFELLESKDATRRLLAVPTWAGRRSLELYLVHTLCFRFLPDADNDPRFFEADAAWNLARVPEYLGYVLIAALGAELLARGCARLFPKG